MLCVGIESVHNSLAYYPVPTICAPANPIHPHKWTLKGWSLSLETCGRTNENFTATTRSPDLSATSEDLVVQAAEFSGP